MGFFNNLLPLAVPDRRIAAASRDFMRYVKQELLAVMQPPADPVRALAAEPEFEQRAQRHAASTRRCSRSRMLRERPRDDRQPAPDRQMHAAATRRHRRPRHLAAWTSRSGLEGAVTYNADIYLAETGAAFRERYVELLMATVRGSRLSVGRLTAKGASASAAVLERSAARDKAPGDAPCRQPDRSAAACSCPSRPSWRRSGPASLGIDVNDIRASDNFFDLGGDSLLAMRAVQQAEQVLGFRVEPRRYVFESLAQLASAPPASGAAPKTAPPAPRGFFSRMVAAAIGRRT